ncbi:MAG: hypothetical protein RRC34_07260 [Lentisphaeria bacterium]|nr:hypothetical protein [Lentisphaeria bacterium]
MMKTFFFSAFLLTSCLLLLSAPVGHADEKAQLGQAAKTLRERQENAKDIRQKACFQHAADAAEAALAAVEESNEEQAKKMKKKALRWSLQAVRECAAPGEEINDLQGALKEEGAMSENAINRFNDLMEDLIKAKEKKKQADNPFDMGMAVNQIMLALDELITDGHDGWRPRKALKWYLNAAALCEDVQQHINDLLDYLNSHADDSGIPDLSDEGHAEAKKMVDDLYKKKAAGASFDDILDLVEKIKRFLDDQGSVTGRARKDYYARQGDEEDKKAADQPRTTDRRVAAPARPVTTVTFTALQGKTAVNQTFLGPVDTVTFTALDGKELKPKEVDADFDDHHDHLTISTGTLTTIGGIVISGGLGVINLVKGDEDGGGTASKGVAPADGAIEIRNGAINETLSLPEDGTDVSRSPREHLATVGGKPVDVVAVRPGQVAVSGGDIPASTIGLTDLQVVSPSGKVFKGSGISWGYDITMPEVTKTDTWVPIMAQVVGLDPMTNVTFTFLPQPGQVINPERVTLPAADLMTPSPVARIRAAQPGPQSLSVSVIRE